MPHSRVISARQFAVIRNPDDPSISVVTEANVHLVIKLTPDQMVLASVEFDLFAAEEFERKHEKESPPKETQAASQGQE